MRRLLGQKLSASFIYAINTILVSVVIFGIITALSYFHIWKFDLGKLPLFMYLIPLFLLNTLFYLMIATKDYFQDFGMALESSYHRKSIKKATIVERIFNVILVFAILIGIIYSTRFLVNYLSANNINVYYDSVGIFKKSSLVGYMPELFAFTAFCGMLFSSVIFLAYKFGPIKVFVLVTALVICANFFFYDYMLIGFKWIKGLNMVFDLAIGVVSVVLSILFTNAIKNLDVK